MTNALVVHRTNLPQSQRTLQAAQYVRMSTDQQRYSIQNQAAAIAAYAQAHNLTIVDTYADRGESGLLLRNRPGLKRLLHDVRQGGVRFGHLLVFDVSRWGRFQDVDEGAHYEFICRQAGIKVSYCAELFENDGGLISSIVKNIKRVMAAEFSRELSAKVHAGACRLPERPEYYLPRHSFQEVIADVKKEQHEREERTRAMVARMPPIGPVKA